MSDNSSNNKRIAKNTFLLYVRMILVMIISLYTSRVVLSTLGVSDFGIYNVVGGLVSTLTFLNSALAASSQRFISYELGRGNKHLLNKVFSTSVSVHAILAIISVILFESVGLWFLNTKMNIEPARMYAANWVFHCSVLSFAISVLNVPYNASIVAHEKMGVYAYISIIEALLKLLIVYLLLIADYDKLIVYSVLQLAVSYIIRLCYVTYCKRKFVECKYKFVFEKPLFKRMFSFAGWSVVGNIGFSLKDPLSNIILNLFFGTIINAARGIAVQVNGIIYSFATNFGMAMNPQIVKRYASGDIEGSIDLVYAGARFSFYLITIISIPIIVNIDFILKMWLGEVPEYTNIFVVLTVLSSLVYCLSGTSSTAVQATGDIKWFSIGVCVILILELPIAYLLLYLGYPPYAAMIPSIFTNLLALLFRFNILKGLVSNYSWRYFIFTVVIRSFITFFIAVSICMFLKQKFSDGIFSSLSLIVCCFIISCFTVLLVGINKQERNLIKNKVVLFFKRQSL